MTSDVQAISILLVEDDHALLRVWQELFEMLGHNISCYETGSQLLGDRRLIKDYDLLITDYYLPDVNGVELVKEVRKAAPDIRAIVLTGSRETFIKEAVDKISACDILYKPLNIADIEDELRRLFPAAPDAVQSGA